MQYVTKLDALTIYIPAYLGQPARAPRHGKRLDICGPRRRLLSHR